MKIKYILLTFLLTIFALTTQAQNVVYEENFNTTNNWPTGSNTTRTLEVKNGKYYFEHKKAGEKWRVTTRNMGINTSGDFEIEVSMQRLATVNNNYAYGVMFGTKDADNTFHFFLSNNQYRVSDKSNGKYINYKGWKKSNSIKTDLYAYNRFKIKKTGSTISFYMNGTFLESKPFKSFYGDKVGIHVFDKQKVAIDFIKATQLNGSTITTNTTTTTTTSNGIIYEDDFSSNKNNWATSNTNEASLEVRNGKYYFDHKREKGGWSTTKYIDIDETKEFEIEAKFLKISGINNNGFGFVYGRKDGNNQYVFTITSNGSYSIDQYKD
ncbi:predicted protein, partial [Nematostella vectensis]